jgi:hypothetical protein
MPKATRGAAACIILSALIAQAPTAQAVTNHLSTAPDQGVSPPSMPVTVNSGATAANSWAELVQQGLKTSPTRSTASATSQPKLAAQQAQQAQQLMRCFQLEKENYCLGLGFVDKRPDPTRIGLAATSAEATGTKTGAVSVADFVARRASLGDNDRLVAELDELRTAWDGREKARALRTAGTSTGTGTFLAQRVPPAQYYLMYGYQTSQERSYWCGPATLQSIDWADDRYKDSQASWARALGTTSAGSAITSMVRQTNAMTNWDLRAGTYIAQSVSTWSWQKFFSVHQTHLGDGTPAPIIEHPQLLRRYFPYLAFNHGGHFQVGRGYSKTYGTISIFEVFNERRFNSRGYVTSGTKNIPASALFNATLANRFKNIGL